MSILGRIVAAAAGLLAVIVGLIAALLGGSAIATSLISARIESRYPPQDRFVEVEGGRLSVIDAGSREVRGTVVLLHGASASGSDPFEGFGRQLSGAGFRVLAFDRPGFGWSDRLAGAEAATPAFQAKVIAEALERLGVGSAIVFGHSWSGSLALRLALDRPDLVSGLVLGAPVALPFPERSLPWWARLAIEPVVTRLLVDTIAVPLGLYYLPATAGNVFRPEQPADDYVARSRAPLILRPGPALANIQDLVALPAALREQAPRYAELRVPTTVVAGEADPIVHTDVQAEPLARAISGAKLVLLPGVGHMLHYTAADRLISEIEAMHARLSEPASR